MNKLLFVNIGGIVFQIDETAYRKLENYLNSIRKRYANTVEGEDIIQDIENRIAELFTAAVGERGAIMDNHVDDIINTMGAPEDFDDVSSGDAHQSGNARTESTRHSATRFYRDKENNVLGGVCAGLAAKFDIDALWIRLIFLVAFFFAGTGFLLYIILWIIIPEAKTTTEKLEMRGEKVDINNIERTVRDGAKQFGKKMNEFGEEVRTTFSSENMEKTRRNTGDFIESAAATLKPVLQTLGKIVSAGILIVCLVIIVALTIELTTNWGSQFTDIQFFGNHITEGTNQAWMLVTCALALIMIPLLGIIISMVKYLLGLRQKTQWISKSLGILWTVALIAVIYIGITIGRNFQYEGSVNDRVDIIQPVNNTLHLKLESSKYNYPYTDDKDGFTIFEKQGKEAKHAIVHFDNEDSLMFQHIELRIERSTDSNFVVLMNKRARGFDRTDAKDNAAQFSYIITQSGDSVLHIPSMIALGENEQWREQEVELLVRVPANKFIFIDSALEPYLQDNEYTSGMRDLELFNNKLIMTPGGLKTTW